MRYGSLFTGICGFDLALDHAGMECSWQVEIDKNCQQVEEQHYPNAKRYSDVKQCGRHNLTAVDLVCGGFPCQDLSVAGKRAGLAGEQSGLWHEFHRIIAELRPQWVVIENVPGLLSSNKGQDFAVILRGLVECGYGVCWRVLDAQYFGVAQRRRRVFIVGSLGDGRAAEVLFEREGGAWDTPPRREAGKGIAPTLSGSANRTGGDRPPGTQVETAESLVVSHALSASPTSTGRLDPNGEDFVVAPTLPSHSMRNNIGDTPFVAFNIQQNDGGDHRRQDRPNDGMYVKETDQALTVGSTDLTCVATFDPRNVTSKANRTRVENGLPANTLHQEGISMIGSYGVRRLTPVECERLQGFPDGWTAGQADSTRYRQLGNAVAVPVVEWIARRIVQS